jgi:hypothetical protein
VWGCRIQVSTAGLLAIDVPPTLKHAPVIRMLEEGQAREEWYFDLGVDPGSLRG